LAKAETKREKADYDIYFEPSEEEAEDIVEDAEKFFRENKKGFGGVEMMGEGNAKRNRS